MTHTLAIRPDEHDERRRLRGCHNCSAYDQPKCRRGAPGPNGWPETLPTDYCLMWTWVIEPRVTWGTAIAPAERNQIREEPTPF